MKKKPKSPLENKIAEREAKRIKAIMSVPIKDKTTMQYWQHQKKV